MNCYSSKSIYYSLYLHISLIHRSLILVIILIINIFFLSLTRWIKLFILILFVGGILMLICYLCGVSSSMFGINLFLFIPLIWLSFKSLVGRRESLLHPSFLFLFFLIIFILLSFNFIIFKKPLRGLYNNSYFNIFLMTFLS